MAHKVYAAAMLLTSLAADAVAEQLGLFPESLTGLILGSNLSLDIEMLLHRIFMLVAGAMVALSIFFVFRPHRPIQPPHQLAATACEARPETNTVPPGI